MTLPKNNKKTEATTGKDSVIAKDIQQNTEPEPEPVQAIQEAPDPGSVDPFTQAVIKAYNDELDKEIKKGLNQIHERYIRMMAQENPTVDMRPAIDELGNSTDWYKNLYWAIKDGAEPGTKEQIYSKLQTMNFTNMRKLEAIQQQYPIR